MSDVTRILERIERGEPHAAEELFSLVYEELRGLARRMMVRERLGQTLQPTALVHEAYLRLVGPSARRAGEAAVPQRQEACADAAPERGFANRRYFFAAAAEAMRRILVENARRKVRLKHGGERRRVELNEADAISQPAPDDVLALHEALIRLAAEDPLKAKLVELRFFGGCTVEEAAESLGISAITAKRYWRYARAWLHREIARG
jgi:RNA polymerase sigma factor (sigma-70 family)